jgi:hypothetical protein
MSASISGQNVRADNWNFTRPMWNAAPLDSRPPAPGAAPIVVSATGLGAGGGAGISGSSDSAWGHVRVFVGLGAGGSGTITLQWPVAPPGSAAGILCAADWATLVVTQGNPLAIAWTATAPLIANSKPLILSYQWNVAN